MHAFEVQPPPLVTGHDGVIRVAGTRVQLEIVVLAFDAGATAEEIVQQYPSVDLAAVYSILSYVLANRAVVDQYVEGRRLAAASIRVEAEQRFRPDGLRARLLARATRNVSE